jgi:hypothetical protein
MSRLSLSQGRCEALFASTLQRSDDTSVRAVREAIARAVRQYGSRGCAELMAQEFGDHPEVAAARMRWAREVVAAVIPTGSAGSAARPMIRSAQHPAGVSVARAA